MQFQTHSRTSIHTGRVLLFFSLTLMLFFSGSTAPLAAQEAPRNDQGTWQRIYPSNSPTARHETSFVHLGGKFYLIGGRESQKVQIYNPATNSWSDGASAPILMHHIQPIAVDGLIYAIAAYSGHCCTGEFGASHVYVYDPVQNKWFQMTQIPSNRRRGAAGVVHYQDKFYIVGGLSGGHGSTATSYNYFDVYDAAKGTWQTLPNAPHARDHFGAAVVNGKLYALGGRASVGGSFFNNTVPQVDVYNFSTNSWSTLPASSNLPNPRAGNAAAVLDGEILVIGGEGHGSAYTRTDAFNPSNGTWRQLSSMTQARHGTTASVCNDVVYIAAGSPNQGGGTSNTLERFFHDTASSCPSQTITPGQLSVNGSGTFGQVAVGSSNRRTLLISNIGGNQGLIIRSVQKSGSADFSLSDNVTSFPIVLAPGSSFSLNVTYQPNSSGSDTGTITVNYERPGSPLQIALSGSTQGSTMTATPIPHTPTFTHTFTQTPIPHTPTFTHTFTRTPIPHTPTFTHTFTRTPIPHTPTFTSTGTITAIPHTFTPSHTPTATVPVENETPAPVDTATSPPLQPAFNLIQNGGFELVDPADGQNGKHAQFWKRVNSGKGKRVENRVGHPIKADKTVAIAGNSAYKLKGVEGQKSRTVQKTEFIPIVPQEGQTLMVDLWVKAKKAGNSQPRSFVKVKVKYATGEKDTLKLDLRNTQDFDYAYFSQSIPLKAVQMTKLKVIIQVRDKGVLFADEVRLRVCGGEYVCL